MVGTRGTGDRLHLIFGHMDEQITTLIAKPPTWQRVQRWPAAFLLALGLVSFASGLEPVSLLFAAVGLWGTAEFWRGIRVTGDTLVAQGRLVRKRVPLAEVLAIGSSRARTVWVQSRGRRTLVLNMAETRIDQPGNVRDIQERLRELAVAAGASLDEPADGPTNPPKPATPFFGW